MGRQFFSLSCKSPDGSANEQDSFYGWMIERILGALKNGRSSSISQELSLYLSVAISFSSFVSSTHFCKNFVLCKLYATVLFLRTNDEGRNFHQKLLAYAPKSSVYLNTMQKSTLPWQKSVPKLPVYITYHIVWRGRLYARLENWTPKIGHWDLITQLSF